VRGTGEVDTIATESSTVRDPKLRCEVTCVL